MKLHLKTIVWILSLGVNGVLFAQSGNVVYRCVSENNVPVYTNNTQGQKSCERLTGVEVTTVPAFKTPAASQRIASSSTNTNAGNDFPKIDADLQKQRDELGRKPILERELRDREERCTNLRKETNNGNPLRPASEEATSYAQRVAQIKQQIERCDSDLIAIRREINGLK